MVTLSRCAGEVMNVLTQLGYTTVEKWRFKNEEVPIPRMPSLRAEGAKPSSRGKLGALMFKRLFALVVGAAVDDILLKADGNGIRFDPVPQGYAHPAPPHTPALPPHTPTPHSPTGPAAEPPRTKGSRPGSPALVPRGGAGGDEVGPGEARGRAFPPCSADPRGRCLVFPREILMMSGR